MEGVKEILIRFARFWNSEGWHAEHILDSDLKRFEEQATPPISKSAKETLYNSLMQSWQKIKSYDHEEKNNHILIAESYGLDELVKYFNETINE